MDPQFYNEEPFCQIRDFLNGGDVGNAAEQEECGSHRSPERRAQKLYFSRNLNQNPVSK